MNIEILVKLQVEGLHFFPNASKIFPEVSYLEEPHRHLFYIECTFPVTHTERDKEFLIVRREILSHLNSEFYDEELNLLNFKGMSCESIALHLLKQFELNKCIVSEDNENAAIITR